MARQPSGIILSGGPKSVNETPAPSIDPAIYDTGIPILGICYGAQLLTRQLAGEVSRTGRGEYGRTPLTVTGNSPLFVDWPDDCEVWMSHADAITTVPPGFVATATSADAPVAALHHADRAIYGVQFHPEVVHTERGRDLLERFLYDVCHCLPLWTHTSIIESQVQRSRTPWDPRPSCAPCPAGSTQRWPRHWCTRPSATSSPVSSSTPASCGPTRASRWKRRSAASSTSIWCT